MAYRDTLLEWPKLPDVQAFPGSQDSAHVAVVIARPRELVRSTQALDQTTGLTLV